MEELKIVKYIKTHGLDKTVRDFKLIVKDYSHKILLKYNQIDSPMEFDEVQEARGLILEKDTWKVMSYGFKKFFNSAEGNASKIDWSTARILEKCDGTFITLYYDWVIKQWCASTTGTANGDGEVNNKMGTTFSDLFFETFTSHETFLRNADKNLVYMFELMTPYNIVVTPHPTSKITLLSVRNLTTLKEMSFEWLIEFSNKNELNLVKSYDLNKGNYGALIKTFDGMPFTDEGYVVVDVNHNRTKVKNPAYVAVHHLKGKVAEHNIMTIVKTNEVDEFSATFPDRKEEINKLKINYDILIHELETAWGEIPKPKNITKEEQKKFAMNVFDVIKKNDSLSKFSGLFFALKDNKVESVKEYVEKCDDKMLYQIL